MISLIAAVAENGVIGREGSMPWHLPGDLKHFKKLTLGTTLIVGRRTFESFGSALPGRATIVVTRNAEARFDGARTATSLPAAIAMAETDEVYIGGGARLYDEGLLIADRLDLTTVHASPEGDTFFPEVDWSQWTCVSESHSPVDAQHAVAFTIRRHERRSEP